MHTAGMLGPMHGARRAREATTTSSCASRWLRMHVDTALSSSEGALICRKRDASAAMPASWPARGARLIMTLPKT